MPIASIRKNKRLSLPIAEETGQILFLRSRGLSHSELSKHFGRKAATAAMKRALTEPELWAEDGVQDAIDAMHKDEVDGVSFYHMYKSKRK